MWRIILSQLALINYWLVRGQSPITYIDSISVFSISKALIVTSLISVCIARLFSTSFFPSTRFKNQVYYLSLLTMLLTACLIIIGALLGDANAMVPSIAVYWTALLGLFFTYVLYSSQWRVCL